MSLDDRVHQLADARITDLCLFADQDGDGVERDHRLHITDIADRFLAPDHPRGAAAAPEGTPGMMAGLGNLIGTPLGTPEEMTEDRVRALLER